MSFTSEQITALNLVINDLSDSNAFAKLDVFKKIILLKYDDSTRGLTKKITLPNLILLVEGIIMPLFLEKFDSGYSKIDDDATEDVAMYGVTTNMLKADFGNIFANTSVQTTPATEGFFVTANTVAKGLKAADISKIDLTTALTKLMNNQQFAPLIAGLFYYYHLTKAEYQTPIAIMAADPYLGFLAAEFTWTHGANGLKFISDATAAVGGTLGTNGALAKIIEMSNAATLPQTKLPEIAQKAIAARIAAIPNEFAATDAAYKVSYENRLITTIGCVLDQLVYITELFNKNGKKTYTFSADEAALLKALADKYLTFSITLA